MARSDSKRFLQVEGVNLDAVLFDTSQLSVIRGASELLKDAVELVKRRFCSQLEVVSEGASVGLFVVREAFVHDSGILERVLRALRDERSLAPITLLVAECEATSLIQARQLLHARIRFQQLRSLATAPDPVPSGGPADSPCELEGTRMRGPDAYVVGHRGGLRAVSESVWLRYRQGRRQRRSFYGKSVAELCNDAALARALGFFRFSPDFQHLCGATRFESLADKMAVLYCDGNRFGQIQSSILAAPDRNGRPPSLGTQIERQKALDQAFRTLRAQWLRDVLIELLISGGPGDCRFPDGLREVDEGDDPTLEQDPDRSIGTHTTYLRLDTLLWGGDELIMVVPAWLGWPLLQFFYERSADWCYADKSGSMAESGGPQRYRLTHAAGLVLCSAKAPIGRITEAARRLAERVKQREGRFHAQNFFDYLVLESIDYPVEADLGEFFEKRYGGLEAAGLRLPLSPPRNWAAIRPALRRLLVGQRLPRRQLHRLVDTLIEQGRSESRGLQEFLGTAAWACVQEQARRAGHTTAEGLPTHARAPTLAALEARMLRMCVLQSALPSELQGITATEPDYAMLDPVFELFCVDRDKPAERAAAWLHLQTLWDYLL
ncbi:MAG: hypothetical protein KDK91_22855, partial [Gammaproteobacteria bacterium]|nr:hypothetical protein [Gammaproteobacteria bacterium]